MPISGRHEHSLVDDWIDILLYYPGAFVEVRPTPFTVRVFPETAGRCTEDDLKLGKKPNLDSWERSLLKRRALACRN
jgi:hypothetical protein